MNEDIPNFLKQNSPGVLNIASFECSDWLWIYGNLRNILVLAQKYGLIFARGQQQQKQLFCNKVAQGTLCSFEEKELSKGTFLGQFLFLKEFWLLLWQTSNVSAYFQARVHYPKNGNVLNSVKSDTSKMIGKKVIFAAYPLQETPLKNVCACARSVGIDY